MATLLAEVAGRAIRVTLGARGGEEFTILRHTVYGDYPARFATQVDTADTWVGYDYEAPPDVPLVYLATLPSGVVESAPVTLPSQGKDWWIAVAQPSLSRPVIVESFPALSYPLAHGLVQPQASRYPIAVIQGRRSARGTLTLLALTLGEGQALKSLIERSPFFLLNGPADRGYPRGGLYLLAQDYEEQRTVRVAQEQSRRFVIGVTEVDRPPLEVPLPEENTLGDWKAEGTTLSGWRSRTYLDLLNEPDIG